MGPGRERGVVLQEYALFPWLTVAENVEFGPRTINAPLSQLRERWTELPRDREVWVTCGVGQRAYYAAASSRSRGSACATCRADLACTAPCGRPGSCRERSRSVHRSLPMLRLPPPVWALPLILGRPFDTGMG